MTAAEYARLRGRSKGWVSRQIARGMPARGLKRSGSGYDIDPAAAIDWELAQARAEAHTPPDSPHARLVRAQAERHEIENARRRGELLLEVHVRQALLALTAALVSQLESLPARVAGELAGISDAATIRARLLEECRAIRSAFADAAEKLAVDFKRDADQAEKRAQGSDRAA